MLSIPRCPPPPLSYTTPTHPHNTQAVLTVFLTYLLVDMALGYREYHTEFGVLSGCE